MGFIRDKVNSIFRTNRNSSDEINDEINSNPTMEDIENNLNAEIKKMVQKNNERFQGTIDDLSNRIAGKKENENKNKDFSNKLSPDWLSEKYYINGTPKISCILKYLGVPYRLAENEVIQNSIPKRFHNLNMRR